jgi:predicted transcriptional regulator
MLNFLNPLGTIHKVIGVGAIIVIAVVTSWAFRLDTLRGRWQTTTQTMLTALEKSNGLKAGSLKREQGYSAIIALQTSRDEWKDAAGQYVRERDNAREVVRTQSDSIRAYEQETRRLRAISEERRSQAARLIADRNFWIAQAKKAADRVERLSAEAELAQSEAALNALYQSDF